MHNTASTHVKVAIERKRLSRVEQRPSLPVVLSPDHHFVRCLLSALVVATSLTAPLHTIFYETHGEQRSVELQDGSRLHMTAHTELRVKFAPQSRHIDVRIKSNGELALAQGRTALAADAWPRLVIAFRHSKLSDLVIEVNKHRDHPFIINDATLAETQVNGSLNVLKSEPFWEGLQRSEHIHVERSCLSGS
jgi:ferric-dicitrate binding protein FerR (iron transport regulator)